MGASRTGESLCDQEIRSDRACRAAGTQPELGRPTRTNEGLASRTPPVIQLATHGAKRVACGHDRRERPHIRAEGVRALDRQKARRESKGGLRQLRLACADEVRGDCRMDRKPHRAEAESRAELVSQAQRSGCATTVLDGKGGLSGARVATLRPRRW